MCCQRFHDERSWFGVQAKSVGGDEFKGFAECQVTPPELKHLGVGFLLS